MNCNINFILNLFLKGKGKGNTESQLSPLWKLNIGRYWAVFHSFWISLKYHFCNAGMKVNYNTRSGSFHKRFGNPGSVIKWTFLMAFVIKRLALISIHFCPSFFLLQLNLTYMKGILHLVPVKIIILKSS